MRTKKNEKRPLVRCLPVKHKAFVEVTKNGFVLWADVGGMSKKNDADYRWIIDASTLFKDGKFFLSNDRFTKEVPSWLGETAKQYKLVKEKKYKEVAK